MKAVGLWSFGGPEVLEIIDVVTRPPKADEVQVAIVGATVNPTDTLFRAGVLAGTMKELHPPYIPGMEFAGYIQRLGEDVQNLQVGQPVMGIVNPRRQEGGAMNQTIVVSARSVFALDDGADLLHAATLPMNGITALKAIEALQAAPGDKVLVTGGAGAVGGYAIQLAKHLGLTVITDSSDGDKELVSELRADHIVPRGSAMAAAVRKLFPRGVNGVVDTALLGQGAWDAVSDGSVAVSLRGKPKDPDPRLEHRAISVSHFVHDSLALQQIGQLYEAGVLTARVAQVLPMAEALSAHRQLAAGGVRGRIVLRLDQEREPGLNTVSN